MDGLEIKSDGPTIAVTNAAAAFLQRYALKEGKSFFTVDEDKITVHLRVAALAGGCAGRQYMIDLEEVSCETDSQDVRFRSNDIAIVVDERVIPFIKGLVIDYKDDLMDSGLKFTNPSATTTCGCGTSFR